MTEIPTKSTPIPVLLDDEAADVSLAKPESVRRLILRRFMRHRLAVLGLIMLAVIFLSALAAPLYKYDPEDISLRDKLQPPSLEHPMGTDDLGRDLMARILYGGRISLAVGVFATGIALLVGTIVGAFAGYYGGVVDNGLMRVTDLFLSFPSLFVLILLGAMIRDTPLAEFRGGLATIVIVIAVLSWMVTARLVRATFLYLREMDYIEASRALGLSDRLIVLHHILPNAMGPIVVQGALLTAFAILTESGLSYLGFGIQPPTPTWGNMLNDAQTYMTRYPWVAIFPGMMIFLTVISVNFVGDGLRDAFDPRSI
ncbi:MAG: ABC transporter permease [Anaerolineales bacterium]|nr:ABC transporter permease [Anaerolineales bacterium]